MKVIIQVSDKYQHIMPVFCELFNKYWSNQECVIICFTPPLTKLPDNFEIFEIGEDLGWPANFEYFCKSFKDEFFILHLDDHILTEYVNMDKLKIMEGEMIKGADKAMLHSHLNLYSTPTQGDILTINQNAPYRTSIHTAMWRTEYLMKNIRDNETIGSFETHHGSLNDGAKIVSMQSSNRYYDNIVEFMNLYRNGKVDKSITGLWHEEDLDILLKIPMSEDNRKELIRTSNNKCPMCSFNVDRMLLKERNHVKYYETHGICYTCQTKS